MRQVRVRLKAPNAPYAPRRAARARLIHLARPPLVVVLPAAQPRVAPLEHPARAFPFRRTNRPGGGAARHPVRRTPRRAGDMGGGAPRGSHICRRCLLPRQTPPPTEIKMQKPKWQEETLGTSEPSQWLLK